MGTILHWRVRQFAGADILDDLRHALWAGKESVRLLVPTATMAQHLQNRLAREGFVFRRALIQTFSRFVETWAGDVPQVPDSALYLIVEEAARRVNRPEFARVVHMRGFCATLARTIAEFSSAGCDSARLAAHLPPAPLSAAFLAVYREVDRELVARGLALRAQRLGLAAERIAAEGLGGIGHIWLDGFHALPDPELSVIQAMSRHAEVVLRRAEDQHPHAAPARVLMKAPGIEREAEEIARRIVEQAEAGRPFHEIGVIVHKAETYIAHPQSHALALRHSGPILFRFPLAGACRGALPHRRREGHAGRLGARRDSGGAASGTALCRVENAMDRFDFAVREQIPNTGLGALKALLVGEDSRPHTPGAERLLHKLEALGTLEEWRSFALTPQEWAA